MRKSVPQLRLFGPDTKHGAWKNPSLKTYVYYAVWYEKGRRLKSSLFVEYGGDPTQAFAEFLSGHGKTPEAPDTPDAGPAESILITDLLAHYIDARGEAAISDAQLRNRVVTLGTYFVGKLTSEIDEKICREFAKSRNSDGTARLELGTLSTALNYGIDNRLIKWRPKVWRPGEPTTTQDALTQDQIDSLIAAWRRRPRSQHMMLAFWIQFYTAARADSVLTLSFEKNPNGGYVDLVAGTIDFNPDGRQRTVKVKAKIKIPTKLLPHLEAAKERGVTLVCQGQRGVAPGLRVYEKTFAAVARDAGMPPGVTPHTLCHTRISWLVSAGVPIEKVAAFVGRSPERIRETYLHLAPSAFKEVHDAI